MKKPKVLILSTIEGHASMAQAVHEALGDAYDCTIFTYPDPSLKIYRVFYQKYPQPLQWFYTMMQRPWFENFVKNYLCRNHKDALLSTYGEIKPDLIVSVNYGFDSAMEAYRSQIPVPYINVLPDPKTFYPMSLSTTANLNCAFDQQQVNACQALKPNAVVKPIGWLVQEKFEQIKPKKNKLVLSAADTGSGSHHREADDELNFLFVAGWEGSESIVSIVAGLLTTPYSVRCVLVAGKNKRLKAKLDALKKSNRNPNITLEVIGFTNQLETYMAEADLVIGKAGPNSLFEATATQTPFLATTHLPGLEAGNIELIRQYNLGFVEEQPPKALKLLLSLLENPQELQRFALPLRQMAAINNQAKKLLLGEVEQLLKTL